MKFEPYRIVAYTDEMAHYIRALGNNEEEPFMALPIGSIRGDESGNGYNESPCFAAKRRGSSEVPRIEVPGSLAEPSPCTSPAGERVVARSSRARGSIAPPVTFRFRLYPDRKQKERMLGIIEACTRVWNMGLEDREALWWEERRSTTYWQQCLQLTEEARADPSLRVAHMQVLQEVLHRLARAYEAHLQGGARFPKYKAFRERGSFTYPQAYNGSVRLDPRRGRLYLSKVGNVPAVFHRMIPAGAKLKTCVVEGEPDGRWFASLVFEESDAAKPLPSTSWVSPIGIDLGLQTLLTTSDGEKVDPPKFLRKAEKRLARLHQSLSRKAKGSRNRSKARRKLAAQYSKVSDQKRDFCHKLSARLVRDHDLICFEDLAPRFMLGNHTLAKSAMDASWGQLVTYTEYKQVREGRTFVKVPPHYSTQECWFCGFLNKVSLDVREFMCGGCGRALDREKNAGRIVLKRAIAQVGRDRGSYSPRPAGENPRLAAPELKPVETGPPALPPEGASCPVDESGTISDGPPGPDAGSPRSLNAGGCHKAHAVARPEGVGAAAVESQRSHDQVRLLQTATLSAKPHVGFIAPSRPRMLV